MTYLASGAVLPASVVPGAVRFQGLEQVVENLGNRGTIACAAAFRAAGEENVHPAEIGAVIDRLGVRVTRCQLGLFGYSPEPRPLVAASVVAPELGRAILECLEEGRISCASCWKIAQRLSIPRMAVASACETLGIRITRCQLGAF